jgi:hypothetical protein
MIVSSLVETILFACTEKGNNRCVGVLCNVVNFVFGSRAPINMGLEP